MRSADRRLFFWLAAVACSAGIALAVGASTTAAAPPSRTEIERRQREARKRHEEAVRRMQQERRQRGAGAVHRGADPRPRPAPPPAPRQGTPHSTGRQHHRPFPDAPPSDPELQYRFAEGQSFAYEVNIEWKPAGPKGRAGRLSGWPHFVVNYADKHDVVLMVIGRLRFEETADDGTSRNIPEKDYWLGTSAILHRTEGKKSGRMGPSPSGYVVNPGYDVNEMLFPELPHDSSDEVTTGGTISITRGRIGPGAPPLTHSSGRQTFTTRSTPLHGSLVRLIVEKRFDPDNDAAPSLNRSIATFDHRLGAVIDNVARQTPTKGGIPYTVTLQARRISDFQALEAARQLAMQDLASMPEKMKPIELLRKRLDLELPKRYDDDNLPAPGTVVGHYDSDFPVHRAWYAAQFVKPIRRGEVLIRYLGSGETAIVHPRAMARLDR